MVYIRFYPEEADFRGKRLVAGFHGIGATGYWSIKHIIKQVGMDRLAYVDSDLAAPVSTVIGRSISTPYEIFTKDGIGALKVEVPVQKDHEVEFYKELGRLLIEKGVKEVLLIGGLDINLKKDDSSYRIVKTRAFEPHDELSSAEVLEDDHIIVGPVAVLLNYFEIMNFPAAALLVYASPERLDPRAAAEAVTLIGRYYGLNIDVSELIKGAETIEANIQREEPPKEERGRGAEIYT